METPDRALSERRRRPLRPWILPLRSTAFRGGGRHAADRPADDRCATTRPPTAAGTSSNPPSTASSTDAAGPPAATNTPSSTAAAWSWLLRSSARRP